MDPSMFKVRWHDYSPVIQRVFRRLLEKEQFVDVTLACEGRSIKCHRLIISACSTYLAQILIDNPGSNVVIYVTGMKFWELQTLVTFMYNGEVTIGQEKMERLYKAAEALKIKGLTTTGTSRPGGNLNNNDNKKEDTSLGTSQGGSHPQGNHHHPRSSLPSKSFLQQHNNFPKFTEAVLNNKQSINSTALQALELTERHIKRKMLKEPPKLVKMSRMETPQNSLNGAGAGVKKLPLKFQPREDPSSSFSVQNSSVSQREETEGSKSAPASEKDFEENNEVDANTSVGGGGDVEVEVEPSGCGGGDDNNTPQTSGPAGRSSGVRYGKAERNSAVAALNSGMSLTQCSKTYGISAKTLSKWRSEGIIEEVEENNTASVPEPTRIPIPVAPPPLTNTTRVPLPPKTTMMGSPVDSKDRMDRLKKATELVFSGVTKRQAAAHFEIPRTTLCAYMKRNRLAAREFFWPPSSEHANLFGGAAGLPSPPKSDGSGGGEGSSNQEQDEGEDLDEGVPHYGDLHWLLGEGNSDANNEDGEEEEELPDA